MRVVRAFIVLFLISIWIILQSMGDWFTSMSEKLSDYINELIEGWNL